MDKLEINGDDDLFDITMHKGKVRFDCTVTRAYRRWRYFYEVIDFTEGVSSGYAVAKGNQKIEHLCDTAEECLHTLIDFLSTKKFS